MPESSEAIIIIKKKKAAHGGHHGGAWKVAYADFVTAMMSLFIVLWLISSNEVVKKSVAEYFQDPEGAASKEMRPGRSGSAAEVQLNRPDLMELKHRLEAAAHQLPQFRKVGKQLQITAFQDGLRIEFLEEAGGTFFELGSAKPTPALAAFLAVISRELGKSHNRLSIEGHTDSTPYSATSEYTNWELSADRANAARRLMQANGVGADQISQVRGFANQLLRVPEHPNDPSNRRITVLVDARGEHRRP